MVPPGFRDLSPSSYHPRVVSIGPLHREDENLQEFEREKATYAYFLLQGHDSPAEEKLKECVEKVVASIDQIRACYSGIKTYTDVELAKMMVTDACFMLELIYMFTVCKSDAMGMFGGTTIIYDLVLVENQIPFFVLQFIFDCTISKFEATTSLDNLILELVQYYNIFESSRIIINSFPFIHYDHILDFLQKCYSPSEHNSPPQGLQSSAIHTVIELERAGVIFKPNRNEKWQMAMEFKSSTFACFSWCWGKTTLRMPVMRIDNITELVLRNLIAYEQFSRHHSYVTSYAMAMDMLVDTQEDIAKLIESKVVNHFGSNEKAANMMNSLCKEVSLLNFYYVHQWQQLDKHYNSYWPKNIASLKRTYFSSPWNIIALLAGIAIFALTVVQTIFTINSK